MGLRFGHWVLLVIVLIYIYIAYINLSNTDQKVNVAQGEAPISKSLIRKTPLPPFKGEWSKILHFIPPKDNENCENLFTTDSSRTIKVSPEHNKSRSLLIQHLARLNNNNVVVPEKSKLTLTYQELVRRMNATTVCEIGLKDDRRPLAWLTSKAGVKVIHFNEENSDYSKGVGKALRKTFPETFTIVPRSLNASWPVWATSQLKCDIISVNVLGRQRQIHSDILHMKHMAAKKHLLVRT